MIKIEELTKTYGDGYVVNIPSLEIEKGECFGLVGNNGAGKTTLFQLILDLIRPTGGHVLFRGENVRQTEEWKLYVGSYLDEHMLLSFLTPDEYFETLRNIYSLTEGDLKEHLARFQDFFNGEITEKKKYIRELSKGNIKKVGIAAALIGNPEVVILDEPFENLDPTSQNRLKRVIQFEREQNGTTFLISSHDLSHVTDVCNRILLLENGEIRKDLKDEKEVMATTLAAYFDK
ncbi:ATP-binding cassette domain-containing protein [Rhodohalobacter sp. SW132]|uniref:ABC transporter ATP-binding protein n=1 Tax=Rhodohalobacter sp. SW132 TaxID=2293433 RepID=UPI000E261C4A|nr:ATP-binding cassette domain-containing protein [Rhodohalobacter sp. SW132]REL39224.1 ATP-binding cassette domain-containing protein [Rhodohalobacter sp. SW132]